LIYLVLLYSVFICLTTRALATFNLMKGKVWYFVSAVFEAQTRTHSETFD